LNAINGYKCWVCENASLENEGLCWSCQRITERQTACAPSFARGVLAQFSSVKNSQSSHLYSLFLALAGGVKNFGLNRARGHGLKSSHNRYYANQFDQNDTKTGGFMAAIPQNPVRITVDDGK
jgi:hypothetical protein